MELIYVAWLVATLLCLACGVYCYLYWRRRTDYVSGPDRSSTGPVSHHDHEALEQLVFIEPQVVPEQTFWHRLGLPSFRPKQKTQIQIIQRKQDMIEVTRCVWENQVPKCPFTR